MFVTMKHRLRPISPLIRQSLLLLLSSIICSCSSGPRALPLVVPEVPLQQAAHASIEGSSLQTTEYLPNDWWSLFQDDQLTTFILTAFERNPSLQVAEANIRLAETNAALARAPLFPNILWGADVLREKLSETGIIPFKTQGSALPQTNLPPGAGTVLTEQGGAVGIPVYFTQYETEFSLTYEFDFWKKNRNTLLAAISQELAKKADEAFVRLQLGTAIASCYFQLQIDYRRLEVAEALVENKRRYQEVVQSRIEGNVDYNASYYSSQDNVAIARQSLLNIQKDIAIHENELRAYLAGSFDEPIFNESIYTHKLPIVPLPHDIPLHLISNRPDILSQLWMIESAGKSIDVARAGFYPDFNIAALFGYQTIHWKELFNWPSSYFSINPAVTLPVFDGGRLMANLRGSEANYDLAIYQYNQLILNAVKEVLDALAILRNSEEQLGEFKKQVKYQSEQLELSHQRFMHSLNSALDVLISEANLLNNQDQEIVALGNTIQAVVALIKALGGGYGSC